MMSDNLFLLLIGAFIFQLLVMFVFYFAALRRLFIPPTPSNVLVLLIVAIGLPGLLIVFLWGWVRHRRMEVTRLMLAWTAALLVTVIGAITESAIERSAAEWEQVLLQVVIAIVVGSIAVWELIPFLQADERLRALMRDPTPDRVERLANMRASAIPHIQFLLKSDYQPYRLNAVECLARMGATGLPLLEKVAKDADHEVATAARNALDDDRSNPN